MPVSGLVITLCRETEQRTATLAQIEQESRATVGVVQDNRLAIVLATESSAEDKQLWDWLHSLPGVALVEVAFVGFDHAAPSMSGDGDDRAGATPESSS